MGSKKTVAQLIAFGSVSLVFALDPVAVVGVPVQNGTVPIRRNINDLASEAGPQWDLFVQSLNAMYEADSSDALSYFQVAGIHGWPFVEWNGTGAGRENDIWNGYCPHGEPVFLPWHRPYVVLYEQTLVGHAQQIASQYPEDRRDEYTQAATMLRAPFWDWASDRAVPASTVPESVTINTAAGQKQVKNPLSSYSYPQQALQGQYGDLNRIRPETGSRPATYRCAAPQSYPNSANDALSLRSNQLRTDDLGAMVYDVFVNSQNFAQFSSTRDRGSSLEQIHNNIHVEAACGADLINQLVAAFDPLFMLHHANVDRLWAYWQVINPDEANLSGSYAGGALFTTPNGANINPDSPLEPFRRQGGRPHTSNTVASVRDFGYSYEGLEDNKSEQEMRADVIRLINRLYSPNSLPGSLPLAGKPDSSRSGNSLNNHRPSGDPRPVNNSTNPSIPPSGNNPDNPRPINSPNSPRPGNNPNGPGNPSSGNEGERSYAQIQLDVEQVERPCFVNVYIGDVHAGSIVVMSQPAKGIFNGAIFLDNAIKDSGNRATNGTSPGLNKNIHVDITKPNGERIELSSVASLKVEVDRIKLTPPTSDSEFPTANFQDPEPVNGGRELTPPPASALTDNGLRIDGGGNNEGSSGGGGKDGDGGKKGENVTTSAAATSGYLSVLVSALLAVYGLLMLW